MSLYDESQPRLLSVGMRSLCLFPYEERSPVTTPTSSETEDEEGDYLVDHSIVLYLVSPEGEFLDFFTQRMQVTDIVERIGDYMTGKKK